MVFALAPAQASDGTWSPLPIVSAPSALTSYSAIYDPVHHQKVVFGGSTCTNLCWSSAVSVLDLGTNVWSNPAPSGSLPPERFIPSAIHDPARQRMVIYGGANIVYAFLNDVWALSLPAGGPMAWTQIATVGAPSPARVEAAAIHDPVRDRLLLVGGTLPGGQKTNQVWALDFATSTWSLLAPTGTPPAPGVFLASGHDAVADQVVLHGTSGTWALALAGTPAWTQLPAGPAAGQGVFDPVGRRLLVNASPGLWALSLDGTPAWHALTIDGTPPPEFDRPVYDLTERRIVGERNHNPRFGIPHLTTSVDLDFGVLSVPPGRLELSLDAPRPNPSTGALVCSFTLPDGNAARLDIVDIAGRRVVSREVGVLGSGTHRVSLGAGRRLPPGVYRVVLSQAGRRTTRQVVFTR
jgi:hypothetical protein